MLIIVRLTPNIVGIMPTSFEGIKIVDIIKLSICLKF